MDTPLQHKSRWDQLGDLARQSLELVVTGLAHLQAARQSEETKKMKLESALREASQHFVIFSLAGRKYAIETDRVVEVIHLTPAMLMASRTGDIRLVHLKRKLGINGEMGSQILVVRTQRGTSEAWVVDAVLGQKELMQKDARTLPPSAGHFPERNAIDVCWKSTQEGGHFGTIWHVQNSFDSLSG